MGLCVSWNRAFPLCLLDLFNQYRGEYVISLPCEKTSTDLSPALVFALFTPLPVVLVSTGNLLFELKAQRYITMFARVFLHIPCAIMSVMLQYNISFQSIKSVWPYTLGLSMGLFVLFFLCAYFFCFSLLIAQGASPHWYCDDGYYFYFFIAQAGA